MPKSQCGIVPWISHQLIGKGLLHCEKIQIVKNRGRFMFEQRRHQRIRFAEPPRVNIGYNRSLGDGSIENISLSGLMVRTDMPLEVGRTIGCEFRIFDSPLIDVPAGVVSRVGDLYGTRFQPGPIAQILIDDAINAALANGKASILSMHETGGKKVMRIAGGLGGCLRNDFMHALTRVGVDEIDTSAVTQVDQAGLALCMVAVTRHGVDLGTQSDVFSCAWKLALATPGFELS